MKSMMIAVCLVLPLVLNAAGPSAEELALYNARKNGEWRFYERHGMTLSGIYFNGEENNTNLEDVYTAKESTRRIHDREEPPYKKKRKSLWPF